MSILKFRAWHKEKKQMRHLDFINLSKASFCGVWTVSPPDDLFSVATTKGDLWQLEDVIVMQSFFGFKDVNGIELFEEDIIKFKDGSIFIVPLLEDSILASFVSSFLELFSDCTVIGNKYEVPNILTFTDKLLQINEVA